MNKIAVLGDIDSIKGFSTIGLDIFPCENETLAKSTLKRLIAGEYGIIYITEYYASLLKKEIKKTEDQILPAIIPIPGITGNNGIGFSRLKNSVERAVGSDIIFNG
ncbi:MAG: V-type ATP synthase subunit F [Clostridia bacterium]|nr:V-type ATP synthase subunit F [Clostridia bacterium]